MAKKKSTRNKENIIVEDDSVESVEGGNLCIIKVENSEQVKKLFNYMFYICKNITTINVSSEKEMIMKILTYLKELRVDNAAEFLKKSNIGIFVKYIQNKIEDREIGDLAREAFKNLEQQVVEQLFLKKK